MLDGGAGRQARLREHRRGILPHPASMTISQRGTETLRRQRSRVGETRSQIKTPFAESAAAAARAGVSGAKFHPKASGQRGRQSGEPANVCGAATCGLAVNSGWVWPLWLDLNISYRRTKTRVHEWLLTHEGLISQRCVLLLIAPDSHF